MMPKNTMLLKSFRKLCVTVSLVYFSLVKGLKRVTQRFWASVSPFAPNRRFRSYAGAETGLVLRPRVLCHCVTLGGNLDG